MPRLLSTRPLRTTSLLMPAVALLHVALAPYSKVEESFSTQAAHDILVYGADLARYDHVLFPGAVPRSFLGPIALAAITYPFAVLGQAVGLVRSSADVQVVMRCALVLLTVKSLASFANTLFTPPKLTQREAWIHRACFDVITACQFHFLFWASRTTPNSIALPFVLYSFKQIASLPTSQPRFLRGITSLTFLAATLRLELAGFLIPACVLFLAGVGAGTSNKTLRFARLLRAGVFGGVAGAGASIVVDTLFWKGSQALLEPKQWVWPELSGLLFNVVEGKSSEWGVSPWHTYFTSSIPKLLSTTSFFLLWTIITRLQPQADRKGKAKSVPPVNKRLPNMTPIRWLLALCAGHIGLLSLLGHKEWRFIVYTVPCFNAGSALGLRRCLTTRPRQIAAICTLGLAAAITTLLTLISHVNYPGGHALAELERRLDASLLLPSAKRIRVHIDVLPAMTGVTLFQSLHLDRRAGAARERTGGFGTRWLPSAVPPPPPQQQRGRPRSIEYDKTENLDRSAANATAVAQWSAYDVLLTDRAGCAIFDEDGERLAPSSSSSSSSPSSSSSSSSSSSALGSRATSLGRFEPAFVADAYAGLALARPRAYLAALLYPHGELWTHLLPAKPPQGQGPAPTAATAPSASAGTAAVVGLSRWWRVLTTLLPLRIKTAPAVTCCLRRSAPQG